MMGWDIEGLGGPAVRPVARKGFFYVTPLEKEPDHVEHA